MTTEKRFKVIFTLDLHDGVAEREFTLTEPQMARLKQQPVKGWYEVPNLYGGVTMLREAHVAMIAAYQHHDPGDR